MREETREHQTLDTFALLPPDRQLRLRGGNYYSPGLLPTVVIDGAAKKNRKSHWTCWRRYSKPILLMFTAWLVMDVIEDYFFVGTGSPAPPIIQRDYSQVRSVNDVTVDSVQSKCFVRKVYNDAYCVEKCDGSNILLYSRRFFV